MSARETNSVLDATNSAIETCMGGILTGKFAPKVDVEIYIRDGTPGFKTFSVLPILMKRFIATSGMGLTPDVVLRFRSTEGQIWVVARGAIPTCDIVFSGFGDPNIEAQVAGAFSASAGWTMVAKRSSSAAAPLSQYVFAKRLPTASSPAFGARARMQSVGTTQVSAEGIQMEINLAAGDLQLPSTPAAPSPTSR